MQTDMFAAAPVQTVAAGARIAYRGVAGTVLDVNAEDFAEQMHRIALSDGRIAVLKRTEFDLAPVHDAARMFTTCGCEGCIELRRTAGRAWRC